MRRKVIRLFTNAIILLQSCEKKSLLMHMCSKMHPGVSLFPFFTTPAGNWSNIFWVIWKLSKLQLLLNFKSAFNLGWPDKERDFLPKRRENPNILDEQNWPENNKKLRSIKKKRRQILKHCVFHGEKQIAPIFSHKHSGLVHHNEGYETGIVNWPFFADFSDACQEIQWVKALQPST